MTNILLINLSPRQKGTSVALANRAGEFLRVQGHTVTCMHLYPHLNDLEPLLQAVGAADTLVFCGPCYINTYPADTIALLQAIAARPQLHHGQQVYGIIQGGMPYVHTHESGLTLLRLFAARCGLAYRGGFVMGMGAMLNGEPVERMPNGKRVARQLEAFFACIHSGAEAPRTLSEDAQFRMPTFAFWLMSLWMNRHMDNDLRSHGINPTQRSPYFNE